MTWQPFSIDGWAKSLGMANVPLFGAGAIPTEANSGVLLDGAAASLALSCQPDYIYDAMPLGWIWSSYLRHFVILNEPKGELYWRHWDNPDSVSRFPVPKSDYEAESFLKTISSYRPRAHDVVSRMISAFKSLRSIICAYPSGTNLVVVRAFNLLIQAIEDVGIDELGKCKSLGDVLSMTGNPDGYHSALSQFQKAGIDDPIQIILNSSPVGVPPLNASLLIRHASGQFYQEAHFELERPRSFQRGIFDEFVPSVGRNGHQRRDARFTPTALARSLVEQAIKQVGIRAPLTILDPACGCGVFLHESLRELESLKCSVPIRIIGFDSSDISVEMAKYRLDRAAHEAKKSGLDVTVTVSMFNALSESTDWGKPTVILMNPPFVSYRDMNEDEHNEVRDILGELARGHFDKSMGFIWKAIQSVAPGGAIASVLPSVLLTSSNGLNWRSAILAKTQMCCVGRFRGYSYFQGAMVEPAFIVMRRLDESTPPSPRPLTVLLSEEGAEDEAMRAMRKGIPTAESGNRGFYLSIDDTRTLINSSLMPMNLQHEALIESLQTSAVTEIGAVFDVKQGALTGKNDIFVISELEYEAMPVPERSYFRPAAGTTTISNGRIARREFVFFPYDTDGLMIESEDELQREVPHFFETRLKDGKQTLIQRSDKTDKWWALIRERKWQWVSQPKIVTAYFGTSGHFAFDSNGDFVCLHGYAWQPKSETIDIEVETDEGPEVVPTPFYDTDLPWAYLAILNSSPFNVLLSCFCPQVQGGQFNLSKRFVTQIPIPDLADSVPGDLITSLAAIGRNMSMGVQWDRNNVSSLVARAYGIPTLRFDSDNAPMRSK